MAWPSSKVSKALLASLLALLAYFLFMDWSFFRRIRHYPVEGFRDAANASGPQYARTAWLPCRFNPLCHPTVKALMIDHTNHYLYSPAAALLDDAVGISASLVFITPDMISGCHVLVAVAAGRLFASDRLVLRRSGAVLFQVRMFLDDLDGRVARERRHVAGERSEVGSPGYWVDGACDVLGAGAALLGVFLYLRANAPRRGYRQVVQQPPCCPETEEKALEHRPKVLRTVLMFASLLLVASGAWNRYISLYQDSLETARAPDGGRQARVFRSGLFLAVAWLWKLVNPHSFLQMLSLAVFCDKTWKFLLLMQYAGILALAVVTCLTELHFVEIQKYIFYPESSSRLS